MVRKRGGTSYIVTAAAVAGGLIYYHRNHPYVILARNASLALGILVANPLLSAVEQLVVSNPTPTTLEKITSVWVTYLFRKQGILDARTTVTSVSIHEFKAGKTGRAARIMLDYSAACDAPASVVVKLSREDFEGIFLNLTLKLYREGFFYKHFAQQVPMPIPKCLYCNVQALSGKYFIMLGDVTPTTDMSPMDEARAAFAAAPFDETFTAPVEQVEQAIMLVAASHAKFWNDPSLLQHDELAMAELFRDGGSGELKVTELFARTIWKKTQIRVREGAWPGTPWTNPDIYRAIEGSLDILQKLGEGQVHELFPFTLCHGDFHGMNILCGADSSQPALTLIDWQLVGPAESLIDVGYLMLQALSADERRKHEQRILQNYWIYLTTHGVDAETYTFELCFERYKLWAIVKWAWVCAGVCNLHLFATAPPLPPPARPLRPAPTHPLIPPRPPPPHPHPHPHPPGRRPLVFHAINAEGQGDGNSLVGMVVSRLTAMIEDHCPGGDVVALCESSTDLRRRLLAEADSKMKQPTA
jgi:hypothetical protein